MTVRLFHGPSCPKPGMKKKKKWGSFAKTLFTTTIKLIHTKGAVILFLITSLLGNGCDKDILKKDSKSALLPPSSL